MGIEMEGILITPLKIIHHPLGDIYHALKKSDPGYSDFGESYFSTVQKGCIKGWKKHTEMTLNLIVPVGTIKFVLYDDRMNSSTYGKFLTISLSLENYQRITVKPGLWMAFQGIGDGLNLLQNIANIEHLPDEALKCNLDSIPYNW